MTALLRPRYVDQEVRCYGRKKWCAEALEMLNDDYMPQRSATAIRPLEEYWGSVATNLKELFEEWMRVPTNSGCKMMKTEFYGPRVDLFYDTFSTIHYYSGFLGLPEYHIPVQAALIAEARK